ncbi:MAG: GNAT family N-acetyltransferase [bacterium]|nr:GNAT family N-acetyltransferase [bacterium]
MKSKIKLFEPIIEQDFQQAIKLVEENICRDKNFDLTYLQHLSVGEMLVVKEGKKVVGVLTQRRQGKIFDELEDKFFDLEHIKAEKKDIGYLVLVAIDKNHQGRGIGKMLVEEALRIQKEWGAKAVGVHCWQGSPGNGSQRLFEHFDFQPLKLHKAPWLEHSKKVGPKEYWCVVCGNPCECDELEMVYCFNQKRSHKGKPKGRLKGRQKGSIRGSEGNQRMQAVFVSVTFFGYQITSPHRFPF